MPKRKGKRPILPEHLRRRLAKIHVLTHEELRRFFAVITDLRDRALFLIAYQHGLRASEVSLLVTSDVDFTAITITIHRSGRRPSAEHDLQSGEKTALKRYLNSRTDDSDVLFLGSRNQSITRRGLDWLMKAYGKQAGVPAHKRHFHALKHSVAAHLLSAGANLRFVHEWLGHTVLQNTAIYLYLATSPTGSSAAGFVFPKLL